MIFLREAGHQVAQTNLLARPAARFLTCWLLAPVSKREGTGREKKPSRATQREKRWHNNQQFNHCGFFIISAAFLRAPNRRWGRQEKMIDEVTSPRAIGTGWEERQTSKNLIIELLFFGEGALLSRTHKHNPLGAKERKDDGASSLSARVRQG
jgi:hypothetical protein